MFDAVNDVLSYEVGNVQIDTNTALQEFTKFNGIRYIKDILSIMWSKSCAKFQEDCKNSGISHFIVKDSHTVISLSDVSSIYCTFLFYFLAYLKIHNNIVVD